MEQIASSFLLAMTVRRGGYDWWFGVPAKPSIPPPTWLQCRHCEGLECNGNPEAICWNPHPPGLNAMETPKQSVEIRMQWKPRSNLLKSAPARLECNGNPEAICWNPHPPGLNAMETPKQSVEIRPARLECNEDSRSPPAPPNGIQPGGDDLVGQAICSQWQRPSLGNFLSNFT